MSQWYEVLTNGNPNQAVANLLKTLLSEHLVDAVFVPAKTPYAELPMPFLFTEPNKMEDVSLFAPVAPFNAARPAKSVIRYQVGKRIALVLRPCEIRALIELVKLKQCSLEQVILIGMECWGRMENRDFLKAVQDRSDFVSEFYASSAPDAGICQACQICVQFQPQCTDITIHSIGVSLSDKLWISGNSETGKKMLDHVKLLQTQEPTQRHTVIASLMEKRQQKRAEHFKQTSEQINSMDKLQHMLGTCLNCYNCRMACPVCYCKECVFMTDVFDHTPETLLRRADKWGRIKFRTDTVMFHLTRLAHISHACVGCGHCTSVCPSQIPVADLFMTVSHEVQTLFDYVPGQSVSDKPPLTVFESKSHE